MGGLVARYVIGWVLKFTSLSTRIFIHWVVFYTIKVSSKTLHQSTSIPLLRRMLYCLAILLSIPLSLPFLDPRFFRERGEQFFCVDKWSPKGRPLLIVMDPGGIQYYHISDFIINSSWLLDEIFYKSLSIFQQIRIYANA